MAPNARLGNSTNVPPTPGGVQPFSIDSHATYAQAVNAYATFLSGTFSPELATEWLKFASAEHAEDPHATAYETLHAFAVYLSGEAVGDSAKEVIGAIGKAEGQIVTGTGKGLNVPALSGIDAIGDFFSRLTEANTWLRVGEFAIGGILLYVALKQMFPGTVSTVTAPVKGAAKAGTTAAVL